MSEQAAARYQQRTGRDPLNDVALGWAWAAAHAIEDFVRREFPSAARHAQTQSKPAPPWKLDPWMVNACKMMWHVLRLEPLPPKHGRAIDLLADPLLLEQAVASPPFPIFSAMFEATRRRHLNKPSLEVVRPLKEALAIAIHAPVVVHALEHAQAANRLFATEADSGDKLAALESSMALMRMIPTMPDWNDDVLTGGFLDMIMFNNKRIAQLPTGSKSEKDLVPRAFLAGVVARHPSPNARDLADLALFVGFEQGSVGAVTGRWKKRLTRR